MAITSTFSLGVVQVDGRRTVTELHTDSFGVTYRYQYLALANEDFQTILDTRKAAIAAQQPAEECFNILAALASGSITLHYATAAQLATAFREMYLSSEKEGCARLATWITNEIDAGFVTVAQVRTAFGITLAQYTSLYARMDAIRVAWVAVLAARGE